MEKPKSIELNGEGAFRSIQKGAFIVGRPPENPEEGDVITGIALDEKQLQERIRKEEQTMRALGGELLATPANEKKELKISKKQLPAKKKKTQEKAAKASAVVFVNVDKDDEPEQESVTKDEVVKKELKRIKFENDFGQIYVLVEHVLTSTNTILLVFSDLEHVTFTPKPNEILKLHFDGEEVLVYYPDSLIYWPDLDKYLMPLYVTPPEMLESSGNKE